MARWTAADIPDQRGRTVIVTGASSGLGAESTRVLANASAKVIMACRDPDKAQAVADTIDGDTEVRRLDLADLSSVRAFADGLTGDVDVLINNAGVMAVPKGTTADGFERHIGTNHLGPFALTGLLTDRVRDRVVTVSSGLHLLGRIRDDLNWEHRRYQRWLAYAQSKLANLLFAYEFQRRLTAAGRRTISVAAHPGVAATEGQRRDTSLQGIVPRRRARAEHRDRRAADAVRGDRAGRRRGACVGPDGFMQRNGYPTLVRTSRTSRHTALAARLWRRSELLTGARYAIES